MIKCRLTNALGLNSRSSTNHGYNFGSHRIYTSGLMNRNNVLCVHATHTLPSISIILIRRYESTLSRVV